MSPLNRWISIAKLNDHCDPQIGWRRSEMKKSLRNENFPILLDRTVIDLSLLFIN